MERKYSRLSRRRLRLLCCTHLLWLAPGASLELAAKPLGNVAVAARRAILACGKREGEQKISP